jgi:hypothetical protein
MKERSNMKISAVAIGIAMFAGTVAAASAQTSALPLFLSCQMEETGETWRYKILVDDILVWDFGDLKFTSWKSYGPCVNDNNPAWSKSCRTIVNDSEISIISTFDYPRNEVLIVNQIKINRMSSEINLRYAKHYWVNNITAQDEKNSRGKCVKSTDPALDPKPKPAF